MRRRRRLACAAAALVVAPTLADDVIVPIAIRHPRPSFVLVFAGALAAALLVLTPRVRSFALAVGAGVAAGGALPTLVSGVVWAGGVPDPLVAGGVAFNLADIAIAAGDLVLLAGVLVHAWINRALLSQPLPRCARLPKRSVGDVAGEHPALADESHERCAHRRSAVEPRPGSRQGRRHAGALAHDDRPPLRKTAHETARPSSATEAISRSSPRTAVPTGLRTGRSTCRRIPVRSSGSAGTSSPSSRGRPRPRSESDSGA